MNEPNRREAIESAARRAIAISMGQRKGNHGSQNYSVVVPPVTASSKMMRPMNPQEVTEMKQKASQVQPRQYLISTRLDAEQRNGLKGLVAKAKVSFRPEKYELGQLLQNQHEDMGDIRQGLTRLDDSIGFAFAVKKRRLETMVKVVPDLMAGEDKLVAKIEEAGKRYEAFLDSPEPDPVNQQEVYGKDFLESMGIELDMRRDLGELQRYKILREAILERAPKYKNELIRLIDLSNSVQAAALVSGILQSDLEEAIRTQPLISMNVQAAQGFFDIMGKVEASTNRLMDHEAGKLTSLLDNYAMNPDVMFSQIAEKGYSRQLPNPSH
jgi:hypothetical protein